MTRELLGYAILFFVAVLLCCYIALRRYNAHDRKIARRKRREEARLHDASGSDAGNGA